MRRAPGLLPLGGLLAAVAIAQPTTASAQPAPTTYPTRAAATVAHPAVLLADVDLVGSLSDVDWSQVQAIPAAAIAAIPTAPPMTVTAVFGDTVSALSAKYGLTVAQLGRFNNMANPDVLAVGQILAIPPDIYQAAPYPPPPPPPPVVTAPVVVAAAVAAAPYVAPAAPAVAPAVVAVPAAPVVAVAPVVATTATSTQAYAPVAAAPAPAVGGGGIWACIAQKESGGNPAEDTGNGFYGMYQFTLSTWAAYGGSGNPAAASAGEQLAVAEKVQAGQGWGAWPNTSRACGV